MTTKAEQAHLDAVAELGCIVCRRVYNVCTPAAIHHLRRNPETGEHLSANQRSPHKHTIPLCRYHHQTGGFGEAYHAGPRQFEARYGTEIELWNEVESLLRVGRKTA